MIKLFRKTRMVVNNILFKTAILGLFLVFILLLFFDNISKKCKNNVDKALI